jgi:hypothetical protein
MMSQWLGESPQVRQTYDTHSRVGPCGVRQRARYEREATATHAPSDRAVSALPPCPRPFVVKPLAAAAGASSVADAVPCNVQGVARREL